MKIGLIQAAALRDAAENLKTMRNYVKEAKAQGCEAVCFPECFLTGYLPQKAADASIEQGHAILREVSVMAEENEVDILTGFMENASGRFFITHGLFRKDGKTAFYRKTHLGETEEMYFEAGEKIEVFELSNCVKAGFQICVETHFPQITQTLSLRGAEIVFAPHAIVRRAGSRKETWMKYIPARSYDNRVFFACCNLWDEEKFGGGCMVTDPKGDVAAAFFEDRGGLLVADLPVENAKMYRQGKSEKKYRYYPSKRRKELFD